MSLSLDDQLAIQELVARYNHALDSADASGWARTFTEDGVFDSAAGVVSGRAALERYVRERPAERRAWRHWVNNLVLDGDGEIASLRCYLALLRAGEGAGVIGTGLYEDTLRKVDGDWRFVRRRVRLDA